MPSLSKSLLVNIQECIVDLLDIELFTSITTEVEGNVLTVQTSTRQLIIIVQEEAIARNSEGKVIVPWNPENGPV